MKKLNFMRESHLVYMYIYQSAYYTVVLQIRLDDNYTATTMKGIKETLKAVYIYINPM